MKIWKVILATLVIFCAGVFAGVQVEKYCPVRLRAAPGKSSGNPPAAANSAHGTNRDGRLAMPLAIRPPGRYLGKDFLERLDHELKLGPDQRRQIEKILEDSQKRARDVWKKIEPEMREEMKNSREEIRQTLTPEQAARFEELMKRAPKPLREGPFTNSVPPPPAAEAPQPPGP